MSEKKFYKFSRLPSIMDMVYNEFTRKHQVCGLHQTELHWRRSQIASLGFLAYPCQNTNSDHILNTLQLNASISVCVFLSFYLFSCLPSIMVMLYVLVVGRLIANSIAWLALGRVPINRTCLPSLDLCRAIMKINTTRQPPS